MAIKTKRIQATNEPVSMDYFLYSCLEYERLCKHIPKKLHGEERWPPARAFLLGDEADLEREKDFDRALKSMLAWYVEQAPKLKSVKTLNMQDVAKVVPPVVLFSRDIGLLYEKLNEAALLFKKDETNPAWESIRKVVEAELPNLSELILAYLDWNFKEEVLETFELGERPPVGRFAPFYRRPSKDGFKRGDRKGGGKDGPRRGGGDRDRGGRDRGRGGERGGGRSSERSDRGPRGAERGDRGGSRDRGRGGERDRGGRDRGRGRGPRRDRDEMVEKDPAKEAEAIKDVLAAIQSLNSDTSLAEIALPPANSYYRRIQHRQAAQEGLASRSHGDEPERCVVIMRDGNEAGESVEEE